MTDHDTDGEPQNFDDDDPAQAPESDPDPLLPLTVENRLGAVLEHAGSMVGRANERGLMFYPGQNRAFLARRIHHPSVSAQNSRGATVNVQAAAAVILASDRGVDTDYLPMARNAGLEQPTPSVHIQLADGLPVRGQPLPRVPANRELQRFISFSGFGGEQEHEDREWSDTHIRNYLHGKRTAGGEAALARWDCQACYDRAKFLRVPPAGLEGEFSAARHSVSSTRVESARDADEFRKGMKLMARVPGVTGRATSTTPPPHPAHEAASSHAHRALMATRTSAGTPSPWSRRW
jgi:hypothetical protein